MSDILLMHVFKRFQYLFKEMFGILFSVESKPGNLFKHFYTINIVHYLVSLSREIIIKYFMWLNNISMG